MPCLTRTVDSVGRPLIEVVIRPFDANLQLTQEPIKILALIDTGSSTSALDYSLINELKLQSEKKIKAGSAFGVNEHDAYEVDIAIPTEGTKSFFLPRHLVIGVDVKAQGIKMLLGTDILSRGMFVYNDHRDFTLCF